MEVSTFTPSSIGRIEIRCRRDSTLDGEKLFHAGGNEIVAECAGDQGVNRFDVLKDQLDDVLGDPSKHVGNGVLRHDLIEDQILLEASHDVLGDTSTVATILLSGGLDKYEVVDPLGLSIYLLLRESGSIDLDGFLGIHDVQSVAGAT